MKISKKIILNQSTLDKIETFFNCRYVEYILHRLTRRFIKFLRYKKELFMSL